MKTRKVLLPMMALSLVFGMGLVACNQNADPSSKKPSASAVPAKPLIRVSAAGDKKTLLKGETVQLTAKDGENVLEGVAWKSGDEKVATVDATGKVTAVSYGDATISATKDGYNKGSITISVVRPEPTKVLHMEDADHYSADNDWNNNPDTPVYEKSNATDGTCIAHFGAGDKETIRFTSSKAVKAEIVLMIGYYYSISDLSTIYDVKFNNAAVTFETQGYESEDMTNYTYKPLSFGELDLATENTLEITMKENEENRFPYMDDLKIYAAEAVTIELTPAPTKEQVVVANNSLSVVEGKTVQIQSEMSELTYKSADTTVATVDENGLVTGVKAGTTTINVMKTGYLSAKVEVTVTEAVGAFQVEIETGTSNPVENGVTFREANGGRNVTDAFPKDAILTLAANATKAGTYKMIFVARIARSSNFDGEVKNAFEIKMNGNAVTTDLKMSGTNWADYVVADVNLNKDANTLTIKALLDTNPVNFDFVRFVPVD